jgi:hypothetical protein
MKFAKKTIPTDIATVSQWDEAKGHGVATIDGLNYFVKQSALRNLYNTPKVGDKIIVYKYNKTENGGRIVDGKLECVTVVSGSASLRASKTVGCKVNVSPRVMLIALGVIIAVVVGVVFLV